MTHIDERMRRLQAAEAHDAAMPDSDIHTERIAHDDGKGYTLKWHIAHFWTLTISVRPDEGGLIWAELGTNSTRNYVEFESLKEIEQSARLLVKGLETLKGGV